MSTKFVRAPLRLGRPTPDRGGVRNVDGSGHPGIVRHRTSSSILKQSRMDPRRPGLGCQCIGNVNVTSVAPRASSPLATSPPAPATSASRGRTWGAHARRPRPSPVRQRQHTPPGGAQPRSGRRPPPGMGPGLELSLCLCPGALLTQNDLADRRVVQPQVLSNRRQAVAVLHMRLPDGPITLGLRGHLLGRQ